jgi:hypothetical protein
MFDSPKLNRVRELYIWSCPPELGMSHMDEIDDPSHIHILCNLVKKMQHLKHVQ